MAATNAPSEVTGITIGAINDAVHEISKRPTYVKCVMSQAIFATIRAIFFVASGDADRATYSAQYADSRRVAYQSQLGAHQLKVKEDIELEGQPPEKQDAHPAAATTFYNKVFNKTGATYNAVTKECGFKSIDVLLPDVTYTPQGHLYTAFSNRTQAQLAHDWNHHSDDIFSVLFARISEMNPLFATQFSGMAHKPNALFPFVRAVVYAIQDGDYRFRYSALMDLQSLLGRITSLDTVAEHRSSLETLVRHVGSFTFNAATFSFFLLMQKFSSEVPALLTIPTGAPDLSTAMFHLMAAAPSPTTAEAHAAVTSNPKGCVKDEAGNVYCAHCMKPVKDPGVHNATNCRSRAAGKPQKNGKPKQKQQKSKAQQSQHQGRNHAHYTAAEAQHPAQAGPPAVVPNPSSTAVPPGYVLIPAHQYVPQYPPTYGSASGSASPYPPAGQLPCSPHPVAHAYAAAHAPAERSPRILDCGASITTVGSSIPLYNSFPVSMTLRMTRGSTTRVRQGTCTLVFPDVRGNPVSLQLPAITSPDIQSDILLVSYHQLLRLGYHIYLDVNYGKVYTPRNECIMLTVKNGVWHFPSSQNFPVCQLHVDPAHAHMVLGRGRLGWHSLSASNDLVPVSPSTIDLQAHLEAPEDPRSPSPASDSPDISSQADEQRTDVSSENSCVQDTREMPLLPQAAPDELPAPLPLVAPLPQDFLPPTVTTPSFNQACTLPPRQAPSPPAIAVPAPKSTQPKKPKKPKTGSALSLEAALKICQKYHDATDHKCGKTSLKKILYEAIPEQQLRPSSEHLKHFVCGTCEMANSRLPPQRKTHPPTPSSGQFRPGESLFVDGSGAYKFDTADGYTQHFIVVCETSHAKFVFPATDKTPEKLITHLRDLQSNWQTKIKKIRVDQEYARSTVFRTWTTSNDIALEETPPYVHQGNGMAERAHGMIQDGARVCKIQAGASNFLWSEACRYTAKQLNRVPTQADSQNRSPLDICPNIPFQHSQLEHPPWGCEMFGHIGQSTSKSSAAGARARRGVFVGIADTGPSYLLYDLEKKKIFKCGYARFVPHVFPLKLRMLAGQPISPLEVIDPDGILRLASLTPDEASDMDLAEYCSISHMLLDVPQTFFPEYSHAWRLQCARPVKRKDKVTLVTYFDLYHGPVERLPKDMRNYRTHPKETVFQVSPPAKGRDYSLRHALRITYPNCKTLGEMAEASARNRGSYPQNPAVALANVAFTDESVFHAFLQDAHKPSNIHKLHRYAIKVAYAARVVAGARIRPISLPPQVTSPKGAVGFQPTSRKSAMRHPSWPQWKKAEDDEIAGIRARGVVEPVLLRNVPAGTKILHYHFVYTDKPSGPKARTCARGDEQDPYPSVSETYSSTPGAPLVRVLFAHAAQHGHDLHKLDVSQAFTQAEPFSDDVHIYMYPPPGHEQDGYVWRLRRPLYGLAAAPACWSATLRAYLQSEGWVPVAEGEDTMYKRTVRVSDSESKNMFLIFHVDDILLSAHPSCAAAVRDFKTRFMQRFQAKDEGLVTRYIGMDVHRVQDRIYLTQSSLAQELVDFMGLTDCNATLTPLEPGTRLLEADRPALPDTGRTKYYQHIVGCLQYLAQWTRPDLAHATHELSKHQSNPGEVHLDAAKRTVRYLKGTINFGLVYRFVHRDADRLIGFADADWAGDVDTRRSLSANVFMCNGGAILWHCKQQQGVATSTSEAEFVSASTAGKDAEWFRRILAGMAMHQPGPTPIYEDNKGCRLMSENPVQKSKTRHIDVSQHKVRLLVRQNVVRLIDCPTQDMAADLLTKALPAPTFHRHRDTILGYIPHTAPTLPTVIPPWKGY